MSGPHGSRRARAIVRGRWPIVLGWLAVAVTVALTLPSIEEAGSGALGSLVDPHADAIKAELASKTEFGFPLLARTLVVERDPHGLSARRQAASVRRAFAATRHQLPGVQPVAAALPMSNVLGRPPFSRERSTTALTYLFFRPDVGARRRLDAGERYISRYVRPPRGVFAGVTGQAPARAEQSQIVRDHLPLVELLTFLLVAGAVGLRFRSFGAPAVTIAAVAVAYVVTVHVVAAIGKAVGVSVPQEVQPVIVVLLFGVVTDYAVFFLSRFRALLGEGIERREAAARASAELTPIVFTAGVTVAAATSTLLVAELDFFRTFGPGLALAVLIGMIVALTLVPALLALLGAAVFWPRRPGRELAPSQAREETESVVHDRPQRTRAVRFACGRPRPAVLGCLALLLAAATGVFRLALSDPVIRGLPAGNPVRQAYFQAARGFAPGALSPTVLVVSAPGVTAHRAALARLQRALGRRSGIALALGPAQQPVRGVRLGATLSRTGDAARYFLVLRADPLGARAIGIVRRLQRALPGMLRRAGLPADVQTGLAGDTALSAETIDKTNGDLGRIAPIALLVIFLILAIYLRALFAPVYLVLVSVLAFTSGLGVATYLFQDVLGYDGVTYYVPFVVAVLLVSLGSDYNVFLVGRVWAAARRRPLAEAIPDAASRASSAITLAGLVLAGSFALLAVVPDRAFGEIAVTMAVGLLLDAFVVRTVLVPAIMTLAGPRSGWPGSRLARDPAPAA